MSSMRRIAERSGVSVATVSRVLNNHPHVDEKTRQRVLAEAELARYVSVSQRTQAVLGLVYPEDIVRAEYGSFDMALLSGMLEGVNEQRYDVKIVSIRRDKSPEETYAQFFSRKGLRGVILRCFRNDHAMIQKIAREQFPMIVVAEHFDDPSVSFVRSDSYDSSRRAMEHLLLLGHRQIALAIHNVADSDHADRRRAYADSLHVAGLSVQPGLIFENPASFSAGERVVDGIVAMRERPTAVYATNPMTALGIMRRAQQLGLLIPRDLSLVGMDDSDVRSHVWPRMSAVCQDASSLGYEAASSLMQVLTDGRRHAVRKLLPTTFEVNGTTAPPASSAMGGATSGDGSVEMARKTRADAKAKRGRKSIEKA